MSFQKIVGLLVLFQSILLFLPLIILGNAINWPDSLDYPASQSLPLILNNLDQVRLGYGIYLFYSILWVLIGTLIARIALDRKEIDTLFVVAIALISVSALARSIGIIRWLTASPFLAEIYPTATEVSKETIVFIQTVINNWGGAIGEILGVSLFTSGWLVAVSLIILRNNYLPRILGWFGLIVSVILSSPVIELFGMSASIFLSTVSIHLWLFLAGLIILFKKPKENY